MQGKRHKIEDSNIQNALRRIKKNIMEGKGK